MESAARPREVVLVVDGAVDAHAHLKAALRATERDVFVASSVREALGALPTLDPVLVLVALDLHDVPGARAVGLFRDRAPGAPVVALVENPTAPAAIDAMRAGAADLLGRREPASRFATVVGRALEESQSSRQLERARERVTDRYGLSHLLTQSPRMLEVFDQVRQVASTEATVLILGETGTGKELVTRAIHERSRRRDKPFIAVNCGAFAESLLESELFGHERGSFTGAVGKREGLFEMASGGTLFLDELGETTLNVQVNLLRVLEDMAFRRVGGRDLVHVDVRILAATNVDLLEAVKEGRFRQDVYYRLNVFPIRLPPLRERREDIPLLMRHFLDELASEYKLDPPIVTTDALSAILDYPWPGNVRQLRAMCERWVISWPGTRMSREHLPPDMNGSSPGPMRWDGGVPIDLSGPMADTTDKLVAQAERAYLFQMLRQTGGHLEKTAAAAGITRRTLYTKMKAFGLDQKEFKAT